MRPAPTLSLEPTSQNLLQNCRKVCRKICANYCFFKTPWGKTSFPSFRQSRFQCIVIFGRTCFKRDSARNLETYTYNTHITKLNVQKLRSASKCLHILIVSIFRLDGGSDVTTFPFDLTTSPTLDVVYLFLATLVVVQNFRVKDSLTTMRHQI